jgi:hypothetical protein
MKCPEKATLPRQEIDQWVCGVERTNGSNWDMSQENIWDVENVTKLDCVGDYIIP